MNCLLQYLAGYLILRELQAFNEMQFERATHSRKPGTWRDLCMAVIRFFVYEKTTVFTEMPAPLEAITKGSHIGS